MSLGKVTVALEMGCGCSAKPTLNPSKGVPSNPIDTIEIRTASRLLQPGNIDEGPRKNYSIIVRKDEILMRFDRRGEVLDYFFREENRPGRIVDMRNAYRIEEKTTGSEGDKHLTLPTDLMQGVSLTLSYVYGYQCYASRQNLFYLSASELLYPCGSLVVVLDLRTNSQRFIGGGLLSLAEGHSDDVVTLAISHDRRKVATGEVGINPLICIWDLGNLLKPEREIAQGVDSKGVSLLAFSRNGGYLAAVDISASQYVRVFDLRTGELLYVEKGHPGHIHSISFGLGDRLCSVGISHLFFWHKTEDGFIREKAVYGSDTSECTMSAVQSVPTGEWLTGGYNGKLYLWGNPKLKKTQQVLPTSQEIYVLAVSERWVATGGQDSTIYVLDLALRRVKKVQVSDWPKAVDIIEEKIVCATRDGLVVEIVKDSQRTLMETHCEGEIWSLAQDPQRPQIVISTGDDNRLKVWDIESHRCIGTYLIELSSLHNSAHRSSLLPSSQQSRAISISPKGHAAVGHNDGHVSIRLAVDLESILFSLADSRSWIRTVQYSSTGDFLAAGNFSGQLFIYSAIKDYALLQSFQAFDSQIVSLDWSKDSQFLRVVSMDLQTKLYTFTTESLSDSLPVDVSWSTWTSPGSESVSGILPTPLAATTLSRSHNEELIVVGTEWGLLDVYPFPATPGTGPKSYKAHSLEVATVIWTQDDKFVLSAHREARFLQADMTSL